MNAAAEESLSALFDGEHFSPRALLKALHHPEALEYLQFLTWLRCEAQKDQSHPSPGWVRRTRRLIAEDARQCAVAAPVPCVAGERRADAALCERIGASTRHREILEFLRRGLSEKEIADRLGITRCTVHTHVQRLHRKLAAHSRGQLLAIAFGITTVEGDRG